MSDIEPLPQLPTPSIKKQRSGRPNIRVANKINLSSEIEAVLRAMFSGFSQVVIEAEFGRGFSGSRAFRVRLIEPGGRSLLPTVIKVAPLHLIQEEWRAYQTWVEQTLPNIARLEAPPVFFTSDAQWGGLRYALVGGGTFPVQSLHTYCQTADINDLCWILENRLFEIMGRSWWLDNRTDRAFQMQADYDILLPVNLLIKSIRSPLKSDPRLIEANNIPPLLSLGVGDHVQLKDFIVTKVDQRREQLTLNVPPTAEKQLPVSYRLRLEDVPDIRQYRVGDGLDSVHGVVNATRYDLLLHQARQALGEAVDLSLKRLALSGEVSLPNPLLRFQDFLHDFLTVSISTVHGDLNLENILVDPATREVSLIDFATVRQGHVLHDLLRLETEVMVTLIPPILVSHKLPLEVVFSLYDRLHLLTLYPDPVELANPPDAALEKPFAMLQVIRKMARKCLFDLDSWQEYYQGLVLYLLGALKFAALDALPTAPLPKQVAFWGAAIAQHLLELPPSSKIRQPKRAGEFFHPEQKQSIEIESPFGTMRPDSRFYIERTADEYCREQMNSPYATTLFVQAPMQTGKSSLLRRLLHQARPGQQPFAFIDFQKFTERNLVEEESFFIQLCVMIGDALEIPEAIDQYWLGRRTHIIKCNLYLSQYIIPRLNGPFILAMDEVERMQASPFRASFFGMLRTWHNERAFDENFARMTLFLSSSTDPFLLINNPHQSPFNVAIPISLQDFTVDEVSELNRRHNAPLNQVQVNELMNLVKGHPFLTRLALYQLALGKIDLPTLVAQATEDTGPFGDHLRHYLHRIWQKPELKQALILISKKHTCAENEIFYRLKEAGLIKRAGQHVVFRNSLYERYFKERLYG